MTFATFMTTRRLSVREASAGADPGRPSAARARPEFAAQRGQKGIPRGAPLRAMGSRARK